MIARRHRTNRVRVEIIGNTTSLQKAFGRVDWHELGEEINGTSRRPPRRLKARLAPYHLYDVGPRLLRARLQSPRQAASPIPPAAQPPSTRQTGAPEAVSETPVFIQAVQGPPVPEVSA